MMVEFLTTCSNVQSSPSGRKRLLASCCSPSTYELFFGVHFTLFFVHQPLRRLVYSHETKLSPFYRLHPDRWQLKQLSLLSLPDVCVLTSGKKFAVPLPVQRKDVISGTCVLLQLSISVVF